MLPPVRLLFTRLPISLLQGRELKRGLFGSSLMAIDPSQRRILGQTSSIAFFQ
jgi:hypothetical protein